MDLQALAVDLGKIRDAETGDLVDLMKISGLDPKSDLRYSDLSETDFGEADIEGWDLIGAKLDGANLSSVKNVKKAVFNVETTFIGTRLPDDISPTDLIG